MYLRRNSKTRLEVSIDEPLNVDWDGNELLLSDILGTDEDVIYRDMETEAEHKVLNRAINKLSKREQTIVKLRFGLNSADGEEKNPEGSGGYAGDLPVLYFQTGEKDYRQAPERNCQI